MPLFDHLGLTVADLDMAVAQWDPVLSALGLETDGRELEGGVAWSNEHDTELILYRASDPRAEAHSVGRVGWQHLAFRLDSPTEVDRLHQIALQSGWISIREPKLFPRFTDRYYASFVEDQNGIRLEFMHNPPRADVPAQNEVEHARED